MYQKRARFLGALGEIGTEEAKEALYTFAVEQLSHPTDILVFRYLASALGRVRAEQAIPLLQSIRDTQDFDLETRFEAHQALGLMGQKSVFDEQSYYRSERILQVLNIEDEQHRPSDWKRIVNMASWLQTNYPHTPTLQTHKQNILQALERTLDHKIDSARQVIVNALGESLAALRSCFFVVCLLDKVVIHMQSKDIPLLPEQGETHNHHTRTLSFQVCIHAFQGCQSDPSSVFGGNSSVSIFGAGWMRTKYSRPISSCRIGRGNISASRAYCERCAAIAAIFCWT